LLWFTWFQVALFDIRFGNDSVFERFCKAAQFGVMVGLAVESTSFDFGEFADNTGTYQALSLILMVSRFILALQYVASLWFLRAYKKARFPLIIHIVTMIISGVIYLGLSFGFTGKAGITASYGWWIIMPIEAMVVLYVSDCTTFLDFRNTNIIERLGLLTLIILGEGVMGLGEALTKLYENGGSYSSDIIGLIICSVLIVYFLYMLYFDQIETERGNIGVLRQQIWTMLHFPFHVCILLVVEGFGQFTIWRKLVDYINLLFILLANIPNPTSSSPDAMTTYADSVNTLFNNTYSWLEVNTTETYNCILGSANMSDFIDNIQNNCLLDAQVALEKALADWWDIEVPDTVDVGDEAFNVAIGLDLLYSTVYLYFFISAGLALIILGTLFIVGKKRLIMIEWLSIGARIFVGSVLCLLATMYATLYKVNDNAFANYLWSPWLVPTVMLSLMLGKLEAFLD
jgi:Bacterial low temperature requirement A protein (LtrA)